MLLCSQLWMLVGLKKWFKVFQHNFTHHQELLDKFLFPLLAQKARRGRQLRLRRPTCGQRRARCAVGARQPGRSVAY
jgi:hypothetical protein